MRPPSRAFAWQVLLAGGVTWTGCFDSDERVVPRVDASTTSDSSTTSAPSTSVASMQGTTDPWISTSEDPYGGSAGNPDWTCTDGIRCVQQCINRLITDGIPPDPDLTCVIECIEMLTVDEAYDLLLLSNCIADTCEADGLCASEVAETDGESESELPIGTCLNCMRIRIANSDLPGCESEHALCD